MPRLRNPQPVAPELLEVIEAAPLAIPGPHKEHEHRIDPYKSLPGAMPAQRRPAQETRAR